MSEGMPDQLDRAAAHCAQRVAEGEEAVRIYTSDSSIPSQMRLVLEELIRRQKGLTLISATNLAAQPLLETAEAARVVEASAAAPSDAAPKLYRAHVRAHVARQLPRLPAVPRDRRALAVASVLGAARFRDR